MMLMMMKMKGRENIDGFEVNKCGYFEECVFLS